MQTEYVWCDLIPTLLHHLFLNRMNYKAVMLGSHKGQAWVVHSVAAAFRLDRQEFIVAQGKEQYIPDLWNA